MRAAVAALALAARAAAGEVVDPDFTRESLLLDGEVLETRFVDVDADGDLDLALAVLPAQAGSRREIRLFLQGPDHRFPMVPSQVIRVPDDAIAAAFADVRTEPGRELVFLSRTGAFSYSTTKPGLRDNIRRLCTQDLLYQVPPVNELNFWSYVIERPGGDLLLLPGTGNVALWGPRAEPAAEGADDYELFADWGGDDRSQLFSVKSPGALVMGGAGASMRIDTGESDGIFMRDAPVAFSAMLEADARYRAPALVDVDGDGRLDLLVRRDDELRVHLAGERGPTETPTRVEPLPEWLLKEDTSLELRVSDLDGDGDVDLVARVAPERKKLESGTFTYFVLVNDGQRLLPDEPQQVLRFEATDTGSELTDVDGDGRKDLVVTKYVMPTLTDVVSGLRLERGASIYLAADGDGEPFGRKPVLRDEQTFTLESLQDALVVRRVAGDLSGDGVADLVEADLTGRVIVRCIRREGGTFGGEDWSLDADAWKRFDLGANLEHMLLQDVNGDGLVDLVNPRAGALELVLSRPEDK
jgi:FG-GAP-like repeat